jgi:hypothetical protein
MGANQSKVQGLYLPPQSGKTGKMNKIMILNKHTEELFGEGDVNFIISSNNIVLAEQTKSRVESALEKEEFEHDADVFTWRSGKKETVSSAELYADIIDGKIETVIMCANATRIKHLVDTIQRLEQSRHFTKKIKIWIDEADASIQLWKKYEPILALSKVHKVTLVSATFTSIFKRYGTIFVLGYEVTHPECYRCLRDCRKVEINLAGSPLEYVRHIVELHGLAKPGVCAFVPGDTTQESHNEIAAYLQERGFVVVIINGERKKILVPGKSPIDLKPYISTEDELNITLAKLYHDNHWERMPFAVTGHYCVGRGVTFQCVPNETHKGFLFTDGIISPIADASTAYQLMARLFGNIGNHPSYAPCNIYSTHSMFTKVGKQESCAVHLPKMIYEESGHGAEVGMDDVLAAQRVEAESRWSLHVAEFTTLDDANTFLHSHGARRNHVKKEGDFYKSSLTKKKDILNYDEAVTTMRGWSKLSLFDVKPGGSIYGRLIICYKNVTDPSSVVFICRVIKK